MSETNEVTLNPESVELARAAIQWEIGCPVVAQAFVEIITADPEEARTLALETFGGKAAELEKVLTQIRQN